MCDISVVNFCHIFITRLISPQIALNILTIEISHRILLDRRMGQSMDVGVVKKKERVRERRNGTNR